MTQVEAEAEATEAAEAENEAGETVEEKPAKKRGRPVYKVQAVDELPKQHRGGGLNVRDRKSIYMPLLSQVAQGPGQWFEIGRFTSLTGAKSASKDLVKDIQEGVIPVEGGTFEFDSRRNVAQGVDENGEVIVVPSILYSKFVYAQ